MDILEFKQGGFGAPETRALFALVGEFCASASIRSDMGAPISSAQGDTWLVAKSGEAVVGFCIVSQQKNGIAKLHGLFAPSADAANKLLAAAVKAAKNAGATGMTHTAAAAHVAPLKKHGWVAGPARGQYVTYTKEL